MLTAVRRAYYSLGHLVRELMKFGVVGGVAFVVDVGVFNALRVGAGVGPLTSKTLSVLAAASVAYLGNRYWTFRHRARTRLHREYVTFLALNGVGLLIALSFLAVSHYVLGFTSPLADNIAANGVGLVVATAFRFWAYRRWVFPAVAEVAALEDAADAGDTAAIVALETESPLDPSDSVRPDRARG